MNVKWKRFHTNRTGEFVISRPALNETLKDVIQVQWKREQWKIRNTRRNEKQQMASTEFCWDRTHVFFLPYPSCLCARQLSKADHDQAVFLNIGFVLPSTIRKASIIQPCVQEKVWVSITVPGNSMSKTPNKSD